MPAAMPDPTRVATVPLKPSWPAMAAPANGATTEIAMMAIRPMMFLPLPPPPARHDCDRHLVADLGNDPRPFRLRNHAAVVDHCKLDLLAVKLQVLADYLADGQTGLRLAFDPGGAKWGWHNVDRSASECAVDCLWRFVSLGLRLWRLSGVLAWSDTLEIAYAASERLLCLQNVGCLAGFIGSNIGSI